MLPIVEDPDANEPGPYGGVREPCCGCGKKTFFWYVPKDVPLCEACAATMSAEDVPTKDAYLGLPPGTLEEARRRRLAELAARGGDACRDDGHR